MASSTKILVVGGGGLGVIAALNLERSGKVSVTLVCRSNYSTVLERGYNISSCDHGQLEEWRPTQVVKAIPHVTSSDVPYDYIIVATKNIPGHTPSMADLISPAVTPGVTTIVLIQNGLNIERPYIERHPQNAFLSGISYAGSQEVECGKTSHTSHDDLEIGPFHNLNLGVAQEEAAAKHFVSLYAASGKASCRFVPDAQWSRWKKLVYNASMNPLCAITGLDTGSLRLAGPSVINILKNGMEEIIGAAAAAGHILPSDLSNRLLDMDSVEDHFEPSMLQDVRKGNLIEHEYLVGEPLREGLRLGVSMPITSVLFAQCQALQYKIVQRRSK